MGKAEEMEPSSSSTPTGSLYHKAGSYAIAAIVASFVVQFLFTQMNRGSPFGMGIAGYIPTILIVSAIPAGGIALCGIPRYGFRKLLWKGIVGVTVPIALFIVSMHMIRQFRESSRELLRQIEEKEKTEQNAAQPGATDNPDDAQ